MKFNLRKTNVKSGDTMNIEQLQYIKAVIEHRSITIAAEKMFVSQSAISQSITALEKELGVSLFVRSRKGTIATDDGKWIIPKLLEMYQKYSDLKLELSSTPLNLTRELVVSTTAGVLMSFLPETLRRLKEDHPSINFKIIETETAQIVEQVQNKEVDVGFMGVLNEHVESYHSVIIDFLPVTSRYYLIVSANSSLAHYEEIHLNDIGDQQFILYGDFFFQNIIKNYSKNGDSKKILFKSFNSEVIKKSVIAGLGVSILSEKMLDNDPYILSGELKAIKLIGNPFYLPITYCLIYHEDYRHHMIVRKIKGYFAEH